MFVAIASVAALVAGGSVILPRLLRPPEATAQADGAFGPLIDEYYGRALEGPGGQHLYKRLADLAQVQARSFGVAQRPEPVASETVLRIREVRTRRVSRALTGGEERDLLFVAYQTAADAGLPRTRAPEAALAFVESGHDAYPAEAVILVQWTAGDPAGQLDLRAIDFPRHAGEGVVVVALDARLRPDVDHAVAFALGDPVRGAGRLISPWAPVRAAP